MWWWRGELSETENWGHLHGQKFHSFGYFNAVKNRQGGWSHVKGKGLGQPKGLFSKRQCQCSNSAEGLQVHGGQCMDYSPAGAVAALRVAKHAAELHVETPTRQGCKGHLF